MSRPLHLLMPALLLFSLSCGAVDTVLDCGAICSRYSSCFDSAYDIGGCESRCRAKSNDDVNYRRRADQCNACIDERACAAATFNCTTQCGAIVP